jgi:hypothetical protein
MAIAYFNGTIAVSTSATIGLLAIYNSSDFTNGGDHDGPTAFLGISHTDHQVITTVSTGIEFTHPNDDGLTSECIYHVALRSDGDQDVNIHLHGFHD